MNIIEARRRTTKTKIAASNSPERLAMIKKNRYLLAEKIKKRALYVPFYLKK